MGYLVDNELGNPYITIIDRATEAYHLIGDETMTNDITKFEAGETYYSRSICDHNCVWVFTIVRRTAKSVWIQELNQDGEPRGEVMRKAIKVWRGEEQCSPLGVYSMSPTLGAERRGNGDG